MDEGSVFSETRASARPVRRMGSRPQMTGLSTGPMACPYCHGVETAARQSRGELSMAGDLTYLVWSAILTFVVMLIAVCGATQQVGLPMLAGNRQGMPDITG